MREDSHYNRRRRAISREEEEWQRRFDVMSRLSHSCSDFFDIADDLFKVDPVLAASSGKGDDLIRDPEMGRRTGFSREKPFYQALLKATGDKLLVDELARNQVWLGQATLGREFQAFYPDQMSLEHLTAFKRHIGNIRVMSEMAEINGTVDSQGMIQVTNDKQVPFKEFKKMALKIAAELEEAVKLAEKEKFFDGDKNKGRDDKGWSR